MKDKFINFVSSDIYTFEEVTIPSLSGRPETFIKLELSADQFSNFCNATVATNIDKDIEAIIYDEGIINNKANINLRQKLIKKLNTLHFKKIKFILSDSTLPIYNHFMCALDWRHKKVTTITMKIDRSPVNQNNRDWKLNEARGTIDIPEEKLIWLSNYELYYLKGKVNDRILSDTKKLKKLLTYLESYFEETYYLENINDFDKVLLVYQFIRKFIRYPHQYIDIIDGKEILKQNHPTYISEPFGTWLNKEGISEGQARLMTILLNNPYMKIDAVTINGEKEAEKHTWVGIVLEDKLYQCCTTTNGPFRNLDKLGYVIDSHENNKQIYPTIYEHAYLPEKDIKKIERKIKVLKK